MSTGKLEVNRLADGSNQRLGVVWDPTLPGFENRGQCLAWYRNVPAKGDANLASANGRVTQFLDMSGNGHTLSAPTATQPLYTAAAKTFIPSKGGTYTLGTLKNDASTSQSPRTLLSSGNIPAMSFGLATPFTLMLVFQSLNADEGSRTGVMGHLQGLNPGWNLDTNNGQPRLLINDAGSGQNACLLNFGFVPGQYGVILFTYDGTGSGTANGGIGGAGINNGFDGHANGVHCGISTNSQYQNITASTTQTSGNFFLGALPGFNGFGSTCPIFEAAVFNYAFPVLEAQAAMQYANQIYGIY